MELQHFDVALPALAADAFDPGEAIPVFHDWVREQSCPELLVDVADYRHVPDGPGVLLIGHQADYALGSAGAGPSAGGEASAVSALSLRYQRKATLPGTNAERLAQALASTLRAALRLAAEPALAGRLRFILDGLRVVVNDRLLAPNTPQTAAVLLPELEAWFAGVLGHEEFSFVWDSEPRRRFGVTLRSPRPTELAALLARLGG